MFQIYLDTTDRKINKVELKKEGKIVDSIVGEIDIISSLKSILERNNLALKDISDFSYNTGPGSFTGLKASAAIINMLNFLVLNKPSSDLVLPNYGASKFDTFID